MKIGDKYESQIALDQAEKYREKIDYGYFNCSFFLVSSVIIFSSISMVIVNNTVHAALLLVLIFLIAQYYG